MVNTILSYIKCLKGTFNRKEPIFQKRTSFCSLLPSLYTSFFFSFPQYIHIYIDTHSQLIIFFVSRTLIPLSFLFIFFILVLFTSSPFISIFHFCFFCFAFVFISIMEMRRRIRIKGEGAKKIKVKKLSGKEIGTRIGFQVCLGDKKLKTSEQIYMPFIFEKIKVNEKGVDDCINH